MGPNSFKIKSTTLPFAYKMRVNTETRTNAFNLINISNPIFDSSEEKKKT